MRLGIAMNGTRWTWARVQCRWGRRIVHAAGEVPAGDWTELRERAGSVEMVGVAVPDRAAIVRCVKIGHPPASREALRQLLRWRLRDDLPFTGGSRLDGQVEGDQAVVLAVDGAAANAAEQDAACIAPVRNVTSCSIAAFNAVSPPAADGYSLLILHDEGHAQFDLSSGIIRNVVFRDGAPARIEGTPSCLDLRIGANPVAEFPPAEILGITWAPSIPVSGCARVAAAAGAAP